MSDPEKDKLKEQVAKMGLALQMIASFENKTDLSEFCVANFNIPYFHPGVMSEREIFQDGMRRGFRELAAIAKAALE